MFASGPSTSGSRKVLPLVTLVLFISGGGAALLAQRVQYPIFTVDHMNEAMRTVGLAFGLASRAATGGDAENAKDYLIRSRDQLATTITFWRDRKREDAVTILRDTLKKMDSLDAALSVEKVDADAVKTLVKEINGGCDACHAKYRELDPATKAYRVKQDLLR
jgi:hypothetical protein